MMRLKNLLLVMLLILSSCAVKNISRINVPHTILNLKDNFNLISTERNRNFLIQEILYRDRYGRIIQRYNSHYGYWYRIRRGDCLFRIARRNNISIRLLARVNKISSRARLRWRDYLFIPVGRKYIKRYTKKIEIKFNAGRFIWPLWGRITSKFGLRHRKFHKGVDIAAPLGTKIVAADNGKVIFSGRRRRYGYVIIINHNDNFQTRYAHLSKPLVSSGEYVKKGQVIGFVGKTGRATGYHLHFEIRIMGAPVDPLLYLPNTPNELVKIYSEEGCRGLRP